MSKIFSNSSTWVIPLVYYKFSGEKQQLSLNSFIPNYFLRLIVVHLGIQLPLFVSH